MKSLPKLGVIFMGVSIIVLISICECSFAQTQYGCNNINLGMREDEVLKALGPPNDRRTESHLDKRRGFDSRGASETWTYIRSGNFPLKLFFSNGRVIGCKN